MFLNNLLILCFIYSVHADDHDYVAELAAETANGDDLCFFRMDLLSLPCLCRADVATGKRRIKSADTKCRCVGKRRMCG